MKNQTKFLVLFLKVLVRRVKSKSPGFYIKMRWVAGGLAAICAAVMMVLKFQVLPVDDQLARAIIDAADHVGWALGAIFLFTWTGTADPRLMDVKDDNNW